MVSMSESLHAPARVAPHRSEHLFALWRGRPSSSDRIPCSTSTTTEALYSPQITRRRQRITLDGVEYWLARVPKQ